MECCLDRLAHVGKEEYREEEAAACSNRHGVDDVVTKPLQI